MARIHLRDEAVETDEIVKIEYLLEALDQARARGELPDSSYRVLTRRYLDRAYELGPQSDEDELEAVPAHTDERSTQPGSVYDDLVWQPEPSVPVATAYVAPLPASARPPRGPRPPSRIAAAAREVPWTVWVALAGALLIVAAAAGFAIYAWPKLAMGIRLGILLAVTAAFYAGGLWLRRRLTVIGVSLLAVGAALVLIDGWFLIDAGGLRSLWWWTLLFAVGSAVHWGMGAWLRAKLFAVSGALAQIAWWWLLGTALSWPLGARAAILTTVGVIWTLVAPRVLRGAVRSIGEFLGLAGPGLAACASVVAIVGGLVDPGWGAVIAALVTVVTATAAVEFQKLARGVWVREAAVVTLLPLPVAFLALSTGPAWPAIVLMVIAGAAFLLVSAWRGGHLRALTGLFTLLAAPCMPGILGSGGEGAWIGTVASWLALGTLAVVAGSLLPKGRLRRFERGLPDARRVLHGGGWVALLGASVMLIPARRVAEPLMAGQLPSWGALTLLAAEAAAAWLVATAARSSVARPASEINITASAVWLTVTGLIGYAYLQFAAALAVHWVDKDAGHVWYSIVMLGLAAAWSHARTLSMRRLFGMSSLVAAWTFAASSVGSVLFSVAPALFRSAEPGLGFVLLAALAAVLWLLEAWRFEERAFVIATSLALSVTVYLVAWKIGSRASAGLATAIGTLILLPLPAVLARLPLPARLPMPARLRAGDARSRTLWTAPSLAAGLVATATLVPKPALATVGLLVLAVAAMAAHLAEVARPASSGRPHAWAEWPAGAGIACTLLAVVSAMFPIAHHAGRMELGLAWAGVVVGTAVFETWGRIRFWRASVETGVVVFVPLLAWVLVTAAHDERAWTSAAGLGSALAVLAYGWCGGHSRVVAGTALLVTGLVALMVQIFGVWGTRDEVTVVLATGLFLGLCLLLVSLQVLMAGGTAAHWRGAHDLRRVFSVESWLFLVFAAVGAVADVELNEFSWRVGDVLQRPVSPIVVCGFALVFWLAATAARWHVEGRRRGLPTPDLFLLVRNIAPAVVGYALSLYLAGAIERWIRPDIHLTWMAAAIFVAGLVWSRLRGPARRLLGCPETVVETVWAASSSVLALLVLIAAVRGHGRPDPSAGIFLALAGSAWCAETARSGRPHYMPAASAALSAAAGLITWSVSSGVAGGVAAAVAGAVLALAPLTLSRTVEWRFAWSAGAAAAALMGVVGAGSAGWSATLALAALAAALAGPALLGLPVMAGPSAFVAFAAVCSLEHWAGAGAWVGPLAAILAAAAMIGPLVLRRGRPQPARDAAWSLALAGALALTGMLVATAGAALLVRPPEWLSGGAWSLAVLLFALAVYCAGWSFTVRTRWGLVAGAVLLLASLLTFLGAAKVRVPEAYLTVAAAWCVAVAWLLWRGERHRRAVLVLDVLAVVVGLASPALLMMIQGFGPSSTNHAIWLVCLAAAMVVAGVALRVRLHFGLGLGAVILGALWLTSAHLSAIPSVVTVVAIVGGVLITLGAVGERRRARLTQAAKNVFAGWR